MNHIDEHADDAAVVEHQQEQATQIDAEQQGDNRKQQLELADPTTLVEGCNGLATED